MNKLTLQYAAKSIKELLTPLKQISKLFNLQRNTDIIKKIGIYRQRNYTIHIYRQPSAVASV